VIVGRQTAERGVAVPVELRNVPRDLELTGDPVNSSTCACARPPA
jgi:hypothetical protein